MTQQATQRLLVRMLCDPSFVARVYDDPDGALAGEALTAAERRMLGAVDRLDL